MVEVSVLLPKTVTTSIDECFPKAITFRRHLHEFPELSFQEKATREYICQELTSLGIPFSTIDENNSVIATIKGTKAGPNIGFRADFDALALDEKTDCGFSSKNKNVMHACGHDAHSGILLAFAASLKQCQSLIHGSVVLIFQAAEEIAPGGAIGILQSGLVNELDAIYGLHVTNELSVGEVGILSGPYMAASNSLHIEICSSGGHGAVPARAADPILTMAFLVSELNHIVSRGAPITNDSVLSLCAVHGGDTYNVIPSRVLLDGTIRTFNTESYSYITERIAKILEAAEIMSGCKVKHNIISGYPTLVNHKDKVSLFHKALSNQSAISIVPIEQTAIGEDFAYYLQVIPGAFFRLGTRSGASTSYPLHSGHFNIDEDALKVAIEVYWNIYLQEIKERFDV